MKYNTYKSVVYLVVLLAAQAAWAQADAASGTPVTEENTQMHTPPPVSGAAYPTAPLSEARSNYLRAGLTFNTSYSDNVLGGTTTNLVSDISYSIWPSISLDETTTRLHWILSYSPGFTFYQRTNSRNQDDQNVGINFQYRLSPHVTLTLRDTLQKSSSFFNQADIADAGGVTGTPSPNVTVIAPLSDQLRNSGSPGITYQFGPNAMIGANGTFTNLHYLNASEVPGLSDSSTQGGSAFYSHRVARSHYLGASYQYMRTAAFPTTGDSLVQTHAIVAFYTVYLQERLTLSVSGGPQHTEVSLSLLPVTRQWSPSGSVSLGWQGNHTGLAVSYSRGISGGGGLLGAYESSSANLSARQQLTPNWDASLSGGYSINKSVSPSLFASNSDGHSIQGSVSVERRLGAHFTAQAGYARLYQSYNNVAAISTAPDTNREWISITYQFSRPLGR